MQLATIGQTATMSSLELVDFINSQRGEKEADITHSDFLKKVLKVLGNDAGKFSSVYIGGNGQNRPCYNFPKREACLMAMSYSYDLQAKVFDRMTELEAKQAPALPDFNNPAIAARAWAEQYEAKTLALEVVATQKIQLENQAPAVEYVEKFVKADGLFGVREAAKACGIQQNAFINLMIDAKLMFRENGHLQAYAHDITAGRFVVKTELDANGKARPSTKLTAKGIYWARGKLKLDQLFND